MIREPNTERGSMDMGAMAIVERGERPALSLDLPEGLTFEEWVDVGRRLSIGQQAINWHIGDWWAFGDHRYGVRAEAAAKGLFGKDFGTLANLATVARKFETSRRRELPFTHHVEVAALPPEAADELLARAERDKLSSRDLRCQVQAIKAANDPEIGAVQPAPAVERIPPPEFTRKDLEEAYSRYVEAMEELEAFRLLSDRELDFLTIAQDFLGGSEATRSPVPAQFEVVFVEHGRLACEAWFNASRITVNRWMRQCGGKRLRELRAAFVKHGRNMAHPIDGKPQPGVQQADPLLPIARMAADFIRQSRYGGWPVSKIQDGDGWRVGTVIRSSEELIVMAVKQGFDRAAAEAEAEREGY